MTYSILYEINWYISKIYDLKTYNNNNNNNNKLKKEIEWIIFLSYN